jgi:hypothetical protein
MFTLDRTAFASGVVGVGTGGLQLIVTRALDIKGSLGAPVIGGVTNGQLINLVGGGLAFILGLIGCAGKTALGRHQSFSAWLLGHGFTAIIGGAVVPLVTSAVTGTPNSYAAAIGAYPPPQASNPISRTAPMATQRNAQLIRALRG